MDTSAPNCVFCKIAAGIIPAVKVLETGACIAFLDIHPLAPGHTLLIPRQHVENILDAPGELLAALGAELPRLAGAIVRTTGASGLNLLQNTGESSGQLVFHLHFHLIPRRSGDGLGYRWNAGSYAPGQAEALRDKLLEDLRG